MRRRRSVNSYSYTHMQDWNTLREWLARHPDLGLATSLDACAEEHGAALALRFQQYAALKTPPNMSRMLDIISEEANQFMLLLARALPAADWPLRRSMTIHLVLALLRFILLTTPDDERPDLADYINEIETPTIRPMVEQGIDQAYPILLQAGLI